MGTVRSEHPDPATRAADDHQETAIADSTRPDAAEARRRLFWQMHDFTRGRGLEVGPLHQALVRRDEADVRYLDVVDRARLVEYYSDHSLSVDEIPEVDYWLNHQDGTSLTVSEAAAPGAPFDWIVASHVIEHVPDVVGWLAELARIAADDAALVLAIPDLRFTFDSHRPPTTVGQMLEAHERRDTRPTTRSVYDHFTTVVGANNVAVWRGATPTYADRVHSREEAAGLVARARSGEYIDCHVWLWTPDTFLHQMRELRETGHSPWFVEKIVPTPEPQIEFRVLMRRLPRARPATDPVPAEVVPDTTSPEWVVHRAEHPLMAARIARLEARVERLKEKNRRLARARRRLRSRVDKQRRELRRLRTAPSQRVRRRLRRAFRRR
jgi:2-polyprenyl-3-methyl-5-hydroxy-6-metoxy-1,4-benzoquinol methylase